MAAQATSTLLSTKLRTPALPARPVPRPHLLQRLNEGLELGRPLTLVSAPAGFGKTTCIAEWMSGLGTAGWSVAWLSLEAADDDPARFIACLVAALQTVDGRLGQDIQAAVRAGPLPPAEAISAALVNDLQMLDRPCVVVLDDFHAIQDATILHVVEKLAAGLPPAMRLVLLTREDPSMPLARLRANNRLTEIRAADLRFSAADAGRFLNEAMGLALAPADVAALEERTEGWIAGLQLAGLSVRDRADPSTFIASLSGSHRYVLSYLTEEVLSRQPQEIQDFMLQTSILDRLSGELCNAVTGRADGRGLLERLYSANLFLIPLDDEGQWYRYHHLFADLLRDLQRARQAEETAELHRRASRWCAQAGMIVEAVEHALAGADHAAAVRLIESHAVEMLVQGYSQTVEGWLRAIPSELRTASPKAVMALVWMYLMRGSHAQAAPHVAQLQAILGGAAVEGALRAEWLTLQSYLLTAQGRPEEALALAHEALDGVPEEEGYVRSLAYNALASAYHAMNDYARSIEACRQAIQYGRATGTLSSEMVGSAVLVQIALQLGRYHLAFEVAAEAVERLERGGVHSPIAASVYGALGQVYYQWHELEKAHRYFARAIQLSTLSGYSDAEIYHRVILSRLMQVEGDLPSAAQESEAAARLMQVRAPAWVREEVIAQQVRVEAAAGRLAAAEGRLKSCQAAPEDVLVAGEPGEGRPMTHAAGLLCNSALRVLLARARDGQPAERWQWAVDLAGTAIAAALRGQFVPIALEALLLRAQLCAALGDHRQAEADVARALELGEPEGMVSLFVEEGAAIAAALARVKAVRPEYASRLLAAIAGSRPAMPPAEGEMAELVEPLTPREIEILRLLAEGCSNQEIAGRLVLSLHTVKKHVSNVLDKLGVDSRTRAVAQARQMGLLNR